MAKSRSAHHSINGFTYQFDKAIISILEAADSTPVTLEGIEDIDIGDNCVQCKYHATQTYSRSAIRSPILAFLSHYVATHPKPTYTLYAHFHDSASFVPIDLTELRLILRGYEKPLSLSDDELTTFLTYHFRYVPADNLDTQNATVIELLASRLSSTSTECQLYYYKNALYEVIRLARQPTNLARTTTRPHFLAVINQKHHLYSIWLCQIASQGDYVRYVKTSLDSAGALRLSLKVFLYIDNLLISQMGVPGFVSLCQAFLYRHYRLGFSSRTAMCLRR
jgi:hypothetical protein